MKITIDTTKRNVRVTLALVVLLGAGAAVVALRRHASTSPTVPFATLLSQGMQYYQAGEYTLAQQAFLTAVRADAAGTPASLGICNFDLGTAELKLGDTSGAIGEFLDATQRDPTYPYAWQDLGIARQATNPTAALVDFDHLLAVQPRSAVGLFFSGILLYEDGQHQLGLARVRQGLVLEPSLRSQLPSVVHLS